MPAAIIYTKKSLIDKIKEIRDSGWIKSKRQGNDGGIGNTLEDLLGIEENNLPIPNAAEWELKSQSLKTNALVTLFHTEPSPTALKFVPKILLPNYGWAHQEAGAKYPKSEKSFRQTISTIKRSDRGFKVEVDKKACKVLISFDADCVDEKHKAWLKSVKQNIGLDELSPQPYWGFDDLHHKAATKIYNCFFVLADKKKENGEEFFHYQKIFILKDFTQEKFISAIADGFISVDFDARTGHNHGTKFRFHRKHFPDLYDSVTEIK